MSRDDGFMVGGLQSPARRAQLEKSKEEEVPDARAEAVLALIAAEKRRITSIKTFIASDDPLDDPKLLRQLTRQRDQYNFLTRLETNFKRMLKVTESETS